MQQMKELTGQHFGQWIVIAFSHKEQSATPPKGRKSACWIYYWRCRCVCGTERPVAAVNLKRGGSTNCGCQHSRTTHGMHKHPAYSTWRAMLTRCNNPKDASYNLYGGRGITVSDRWRTFENFWADVGATWRPNYMIDRIDNDGCYERNNCRWVTPLQSAQNRRSNRVIPTPQGPMNVTQAAKLMKLPRQTIYARIYYGWKDEDLLLPVGVEHDAKGRFVHSAARTV